MTASTRDAAASNRIANFGFLNFAAGAVYMAVLMLLGRLLDWGALFFGGEMVGVAGAAVAVLLAARAITRRAARLAPTQTNTRTN